MREPVFFVDFIRKGKRFSIAHDILSFEFIDSEESLDQLTISVSDPKLSLIEHDFLIDDRETSLEVKFGYKDNMSGVKKLVLSSLVPTFPQSGASTLTIKAYDRGCLMTGNIVQLVWEREDGKGYRYSDLAVGIAKKYGLVPKVETTDTVVRRVAQGNLSDMEFLQGLANTSKALNASLKGVYKVYVQNNELHFHPEKIETKVVESFTYYKDRKGKVLSFTPEGNAQANSGAGTEVKGTTINTESGEIETVISNNYTTDRTVLGTDTLMVDGNVGNNGTTGCVVSTPKNNSDNVLSGGNQSVTLTDNTYKDSDMDSVKAKLVIEGDPKFEAKCLIEINNVGKKYSGKWFVREVRHTLGSSGFTTELSLVRNAIYAFGNGTKADGTTNNNSGTSGNRVQNSGYIIDGNGNVIKGIEKAYNNSKNPSNGGTQVTEKPTSPPKTSTKTGKVYNTDGIGLNIRKSASTSSARVGGMPEGATCTVNYESGNWYNVSYGGVSGFASKDYIKIIGESTSQFDRYMVQRGDTLWGIAIKYGTTWQYLWQINKSTISNPDVIFPGEYINVPRR